jgi:hypothetical protein
MARRYQGKAQFLVIYIKEAHPADDWRNRINQRLRYVKDPTTLMERCQVASTCVNDLGLEIPCLIDDIDNTAARAYKGWPDRLFVVGRDGRVVYTGDPGPFGFLPTQMERALREELGLAE